MRANGTFAEALKMSEDELGKAYVDLYSVDRQHRAMTDDDQAVLK